MKYSIAKVYPLVACCLFLTACWSAQDYANDAWVKLADESAKYQTFRNNLDARGEAPASALARWANSASVLEASVGSIVSQIQSKPDQRSEIADDLNRLQSELDQILERDLEVTLQLPSWTATDATNSATTVNRAFERIRAHYANLYGSTDLRTKIVVSIVIDQSFKDTKPDCIEKVRTASFADPYQSDCIEGAQKYCGHQLDLDCVQNIVSQAQVRRGLDLIGGEGGGSLCATVTESRGAPYRDRNGNKQPGEVSRSKKTKGWWKDFPQCHQHEGVYNR